MSNSGSAPDLKELLTGAQLPALPQSAIRLLELSQDPDNGPSEFAVPIEADPGLTGQVLRFVNSSYFGFSREISSVKLAITLVGVRTIKNFALWSAVFSLMPNPKCGPFDLKSLWQDSLRRALFARNMGELLGLPESEDLFASSLLQDMAMPLLAKDLADKYVELLEARKEGRVRLSELEQERFGWTHADAAAIMARSWSLPDEFAEMVESHTQITELMAAEKSDPRKLAVCISSLLPTVADEEWHEFKRCENVFEHLAPADGLSLLQMLERVDDEFEEFAPVLKLTTPSISLADVYQQSQAEPTTS